MTIPVSHVEAVIAQSEGCATLPVCMCDYPVDIWVVYWQLFKLCETPADVKHLMKILCCVLAGKGTYKVPTAGSGGGTSEPKGEGLPGQPPITGGMSKPPWAECTDWFTSVYCTTTKKAALTTALYAMKAYYATADAASTGTDPKLIAMGYAIYVVERILALCAMDPATEGDKIKGNLEMICKVIDQIKPDVEIPIFGKFFQNEHIKEFISRCCGKKSG
jgi:hypothetical protein